MGGYKRVEDILGAITEREQIHGLVEPKVPSPAIYRRAKHNPKGCQRPTLKVGARLVFPITRDKDGISFDSRWRKGEIAGYALGVVLDWSSRQTFWDSTDAIIQITKVSNEEFSDLVGRLWSISVDSYGPDLRFPLFTPEECVRSDYGL